MMKLEPDYHKGKMKQLLQTPSSNGALKSKMRFFPKIITNWSSKNVIGTPILNFASVPYVELVSPWLKLWHLKMPCQMKLAIQTGRIIDASLETLTKYECDPGCSESTQRTKPTDENNEKVDQGIYSNRCQVDNFVVVKIITQTYPGNNNISS